LTGFDECEAIAVFSRDYYHIFLRPRHVQSEIWNGKRLGLENALVQLLADESSDIAKIETILPKIIQGKTLYFKPKFGNLSTRLVGLLSKHNLLDPSNELGEMRLIKDVHEQDLMQKAAHISVEAHQYAMQNLCPKMYEYEVQSYFDACFKRHRAEHAYPPIVASGGNACILHYINNDQRLKEGELILIDAGCELDYYASDITRTLPISGQFSLAQKQIYNLVLQAQQAAIACIKPKVKVDEPHNIAHHIIHQGLMELGILPKNASDAKAFFIHGTGHWLGLDVHDVGAYKCHDVQRVFEAGMVITVEPGIYIYPDGKIDSKYHHIGVRIEDDILVNATGNIVLTRALPKEIDDIEQQMSAL
jgi:Xaa-Pro aminopeptidase